MQFHRQYVTCGYEHSIENREIFADWERLHNENFQCSGADNTQFYNAQIAVSVNYSEQLVDFWEKFSFLWKHDCRK